MKTPVKDLAVKRCIEACFTGGDVLYSADGTKLFTTCTNVVKVIDLKDNLNTITIGDAEDTARITALCMDNERNALVISYNNGLVRIYSLPTTSDGKPEVIRTWKTMHTAPILILKFNEDYSLLATGSSDYNVKIWNIAQQSCMHQLKGSAVVTAVTFIKNNKILVGYMPGNVSMFNLNAGIAEKLIHEWKNHQSQITSILEIPDSHNAILLSRDQTCSVVDVETTKTLKTWPLFEAIESAAIAHNGNLITVGDEGVLKEWKIDGAKMLRKHKFAGHGLIFVSYNPFTNILLVVSEEENIYLINFDDFSMERQIVGFHDEVFSLCVIGRTAENAGTLAVGANTNQIRLYDMNTWDCRLVEGHSGSVLSVISPSWKHQLVASCSKDNSIILWNYCEGLKDSKTMKDLQGTLKPIALGTGHTNAVSSLSFSHSGKKPFVLSVSYDTTLKLWDLGKVVGLNTVDTVEEGHKLSCSSTIVAHIKDITCVDCAPNDSMCLTASMDKSVKLWSIDTLKMQIGIVGTISGHKRGVWSAKFSLNAQKIVTGSGDKTMKVFRVSDRSCMQTLSGHVFAVLQVSWINNASQLISADSGGVMKIWEEHSGLCMNSIEGHTDKVWSLTPSSDESEYMTAGSDGKIVVWKDVSEEKKEEEEKVRRQRIHEEQTLSNLLDQNRFLDALDYALGLARPFCALKVVNELIEREELADAIGKLDKIKLQTLVDFATQWNTNSRTANAAQQILFCLLSSMTPEDILQMNNISQTIQAFLPYTKRHMERLNKARQDVALLEFTFSQMRQNVN